MFLKQVYKGENELWQYLVTIFLVLTGYLFIGQIPITIAVWMGMNADSISELEQSEFYDTMDFSLLNLDQNLILFLLLLMFVVAMAALIFGVTKIHKRPFLSVITARSSIDYGRFFFAFFLWIGLTLLVEFVGYLFSPESYFFQFQWQPFIILLFIAIVLLPIQIGFEEIFIRGYLLQGIGLMSKSRWSPLIWTSVIFGVMHFMNPEVREFGFWTMMSYYVGIALFLGILTLLDDGLELALGIHFATNFYGAVFVTFDESAIKTPALFKLNEVDPTSMAIYSLVAALIFLFIVIKKYNLTHWNKVYGDIEKPINDFSEHVE